MYSKYWVAICVAVFVSTITAVPVPADRLNVRVELVQHQKRVKEFKCAVPQLRSYKITEILPSGQVATSDVVRPSSTVIRTCDEGAGCCGTDTKICAPASVEYEEVEVKVSNLVNSTGAIRTLRIEHHKECKCQLRTEMQNQSLSPNVTLID